MIDCNAATDREYRRARLLNRLTVIALLILIGGVFVVTNFMFDKNTVIDGDNVKTTILAPGTQPPTTIGEIPAEPVPHTFEVVESQNARDGLSPEAVEELMNRP